LDRAGWQPGKAGCSRPAGLQPSRRPLEAGHWQLQLALLLLEGQADWKQQVERLARLALVLVRLRLALALAPVLVRLRLALVLQQVPVLQLALVLRLALVLQQVPVLQLALVLQLVWAP
jgi:hypothetical protein